jgi:hypothetical protein
MIKMSHDSVYLKIFFINDIAEGGGEEGGREREILYILGLGEWVGLYSTMGYWPFCSIMGHQMFYICNIIFILYPFNRYFSCIYIILDISIATVQNT